MMTGALDPMGMPLALVGETAKLMPVWIEDGVARKTQGTLENVYREHEKGESILIAQGYELEREITLEDNENT